MKPTLGSLFSGIGGFELGFERAGFKTIWQVELDEYCRRVLARHFPEAERFNDVRECGAHNLKAVDVICGGFPCQDVSDAGAKRGVVDGTRSSLYAEVLRIYCEIRPTFIVLENVSALLKRGIDRVLGDLAEMGMDAEWCCLPACRFGSPHERDRIFILAYSAGFGLSQGVECFPLLEEPRVKSLHWRKGCVDTPRVFRMADGIPAWMDRLKGCGNAVVPQIAEWIAHRIKAALEREGR